MTEKSIASEAHGDDECDRDERERVAKRLPAPARGAERPDGTPQPASPTHKQPASILGEILTAPENQPGRNPNGRAVEP